MTKQAAIIGGGPAGLMAAEVLLARGVTVDIFDAMPSLGRKFLMAGKSGLNLTHNEPQEDFLARFGAAREHLAPAIGRFDAEAIRGWSDKHGIETFVGSSGRVFPTNFKAAPLLRTWLRRLRAAGGRIHVRHKWTGWNDDGALTFAAPTGGVQYSADATVLALGGGSWPRLGSDGQWMPVLDRVGARIHPFKPANSGFEIEWSAHFRERFSGDPIKSVALTFSDRRLEGEFVVSETGVEGSAIYALSAALRDAISRDGGATLFLDLTPDRSVERLVADISRPQGKRSMSNHLRRVTGLTGVKTGLLREICGAEVFADPKKLAESIKALPLHLQATRPLEEAISSAGGVAFDAMNEDYMLTTRAGVFCAGEMLDWEAPTGGYLLTACFATGRAAGEGAARWLAQNPS